jgi:hypothetical protein
MKSLLSAAVLILALSVSALAQQKEPTFYKGKHSTTEKPAKSTSIAPPMKGTAESANSRDLNLAEHQTAKAIGPSHQPKPKAPVVKTVKDKPDPPMVFNGTGSKATGSLTQSANPYRGRLKQKNSGNVH